MISMLEAWEHVKDRESGGNIRAIGDGGMAAGAGQMWWVFRKDWWPAWAWELLEALDYMAFRKFVKANAALGLTLRGLYEEHYNPHSRAPELPDEMIDLKS